MFSTPAHHRSNFLHTTPALHSTSVLRPTSALRITPALRMNPALHPTPSLRTTPALHPAPGPVGGDGAGSVRVFVRCRPLLPREQEDQSSVLTFTPDTNQVCVHDGSGRVFQYAGVFKPGSGQGEVFNRAVAPLVDRVRAGGSCTVLAYGQTGSGKSHTMGTHPSVVKEDEGILQRAIRALLSPDEPKSSSVGSLDVSQPSRRGGKWQLTISMLEVYNDTVYDLLTPTRQPVNSKHTVGGGLEVTGAVEEEVWSVEEGIAMLEKGETARSTHSTSMNQHSSRSHALIYLNLISSQGRGWLTLVDLAGSECAGRIAGSSTTTFSEGISINKSLLTLGKVLNCLAAPTQGFVPYRESMLTRLLKDSVGGAGQTVMVACVTPARFSLPQTLTTLNYAQQATHIKPRPLPQPSTTKKKLPMKRGRGEDVTATPGAWKRRRGGAEHNTTISTPGHRPPACTRPAPALNSTLATPSCRIIEVLGVSEVGGRGQGRTGDRFLMPPPPPIFEDDSPSSLSCVSAIDTEANVSSFSPLVERVTSQLERTMLSQLEGMEDRIAESVISRFTAVTKKCGRPKKNTKQKHLSRSSTPAEDEARDNSSKKNSENWSSKQTRRQSRRIRASMDNGRRSEGANSSSDASEEDLLGTSLVRALLGGREMKHVLREVMTEVLEINPPTQLHKGSKTAGGRTDSRVLADIINLKEDKHTHTLTVKKDEVCVPSPPFLNPGVLVDRTVRKSTIGEGAFGLPVTSTAVFEGRAVRRSTRLSTRLSYHVALAKNFSPSEDATSFMSDREGDVTVLHNESLTSAPTPSFLHNMTVSFTGTSDGSPVLRPSKVKRKTIAVADLAKIDNIGYVNLTTNLHSQFDDVKQESTKINAEVMKRICTLPSPNNIQTTDVTDASASFYTNARYTAQSETQGRKSDIMASPDPNSSLFLPDETLHTRRTDDNNSKRRKSRRVSAMMATQLNHQILHRKSPLQQQSRKTKGKKDVSMVGAGGGRKKYIAVSPTLKEQHSQNVLQILNEGDLRALQKLPTVGPKTAMVIYQYRNLCGRLDSVEEIREIPGLTKNYHSRFIKANMLDL